MVLVSKIVSHFLSVLHTQFCSCLFCCQRNKRLASRSSIGPSGHKTKLSRLTVLPPPNASATTKTSGKSLIKWPETWGGAPLAPKHEFYCSPFTFYLSVSLWRRLVLHSKIISIFFMESWNGINRIPPAKAEHIFLPFFLHAWYLPFPCLFSPPRPPPPPKLGLRKIGLSG